MLLGHLHWYFVLIFDGVCWNLWCLRYILYRRRFGDNTYGKNMFTKDGLCEFNSFILLVSGIAGFTVSSLIHAVSYILILHISTYPNIVDDRLYIPMISHIKWLGNIPY